QDHFGAVADVGGGDLGTGSTGPDHGDLSRPFGQRPRSPGVKHPVGELDSGDRLRDRTGGEDHLAGTVNGFADLDVTLGGEAAFALDQLDLVLVEETLDAAGKARRNICAPLSERLPVEFDALNLDPDVGAVLRIIENLGRV